MNMGGFQFDPANSAKYLMEGGKLSLDAKNSALAALLYPFGAGAGTNPGGSPTGTPRSSGGSPSSPGGGGGGGGGGFNFTPQQIAQLVQNTGLSQQELWNIFGKISSPFGVDPETQASVINSGLAEIMGWDPTDASGWGLGGTSPIGSNPLSGLAENPYSWGETNLPPWTGWGTGGGINNPFPEDWWQDIDFSTWFNP
jgi:hypothetical protein